MFCNVFRQGPRFTSVCGSWKYACIYVRIIRNSIVLFVAFHSFPMSINLVHAIAILRLIYVVPSSSAYRHINEPIYSQLFTIFLLHVLLTLVGSRHTNTSIIFVFFILRLHFLLTMLLHCAYLCMQSYSV